MPSTWRELAAPDQRPDDPEDSTIVGLGYLARLYGRFPELPDPGERILAALAAYNGGRAYVNAALALARTAAGAPASNRAWRASGSPPGPWQTWSTWSHYLRDDACQVRGKHPDASQMIDYVARIAAGYTALTRPAAA